MKNKILLVILVNLLVVLLNIGLSFALPLSPPYNSPSSPSAAGVIKMGTSATNTNPHIGSDYTTGLYSDTDSVLEIATAGVERVRVNALGYVGIGVSPTSPLDVATTATLGIRTNGYNAYWSDVPNGNLIVGKSGAMHTISQSGGGYNGTRNTCAGLQCLNILTTGYVNACFGSWSCYHLTSGSFNSFLGDSSGASITTGVNNSGVGYASGGLITEGTNNTCIGYSCGYNATTESNTVGVGSLAIRNMKGNGNTGVGFGALSGSSTPANNIGTYNTAIGYNSGNVITSGYYNFLGGVNAGLALTTGAYNVFLGPNTGKMHTTGSGNILIGKDVAATSITASDEINIGDSLKSRRLIRVSTNVAPVATTFCTSPSVVANNGSWGFTINVGTSCSTSVGVITLTAATTGWNCFFNHSTSPELFIVSQTSSTTTTVNLTNYSRTTGLATNWVNSNVIIGSCFAY